MAVGAESAPVITYGHMLRRGVWRHYAHNGKHFVKGTGKLVTFNERYGLNSLGQTNQFTPLVMRNVLKIPKVLRWTIGIGGSGAAINWGYKKTTN